MVATFLAWPAKFGRWFSSLSLGYILAHAASIALAAPFAGVASLPCLLIAMDVFETGLSIDSVIVIVVTGGWALFLGFYAYAVALGLIASLADAADWLD